MAYKNKLIVRDITTPANSWRKYTRNASGGWTYLGQEAKGPWTGMQSLVRSYVSRGYNTLPGWKALLETNGYLPTNSMSESQHRHNQMSTSGCVFMSNDGTSKVECDYAPHQVRVMSAGPGYLSTAAQQDGVVGPAKSRVLAKTRDMKVNVAVAFGEGRKTVQMLADTARTLGKAYSAFRKGNFKKVARELGIDRPAKGFANHWLAYQYGWRPLLSDAVGLAELAAQHLELGGRPVRFRVTGGNTGGIGVNQVTVTNQGSTWTVRGNYRVNGRWVYRAQAGLLLESDFTPAALAAQTGFGLTDLSLFAWETTPFSFVFDWFVDVGTRLEEMSSLQGWVVLAGWESLSQSFQGDHIWESLIVSSASGIGKAGHLVTGSVVIPFSQRYYKRSAWAGQPPSIRTPVWDALNANRVTTLGSLWRQRCSGDRKPGAYRP